MPLTISGSSVSRQLKEGTATAHEASEQMMIPALEKIRSKEDYAAILKTFYGFFHPLEEMVSSHITTDQLPDIAERRNAALILSDLQSLGSSLPTIQSTDLPHIKGLPEALGAMYVMEGSTLGGRMIARMLQKLDVLGGGGAPVRFFDGYGEQTGSKWKTFTAFLDMHGADAEAIVAAANETFGSFTRWMRNQFNYEQKD